MDRKYLIGGGVLLALVLVLGMFFPRPGPSVVERVIERLGATPGTSVDSKFYSIGGQNFYQAAVGFDATSSVLCAFKNPFAPATTSIDFISVSRTTSFAAASEFDISTSTGQFGSSTVALVLGRSVAAASQDTTLWTPRHASTSVFTVNDGAHLGRTLYWSDDAISNPYILTGTQWLTVKNATDTPRNETIKGLCGFRGTKL